MFGADCAPTTPVEITRAAAQASNVDFSFYIPLFYR